MHRTRRHSTRVGLALIAALGLGGCGDDDGGGSGSHAGNGGEAGDDGAGSGGRSGRGGAGGGGSGEPDASTSIDGGGAQTLCAKYGGPENVGNVMKVQVYDTIAADCRINAFFSELPKAGVVRLGDCLAIQAQELFGCPGITYAGSTASNGMPCRSMTEAHAGMGVGQGDFDALIEDVVAGLTEAGVEEADIQAAAPALLGLSDQIVEAPASADPTMDACDADGGT